MRKGEVFEMHLNVRRSILLWLLIWIAVPVLAQHAVLKGKVTDEKTEEPLPYVNIGIKDHEIGTFTDSNGIYRLDLPYGMYVLVFLFHWLREA